MRTPSDHEHPVSKGPPPSIAAQTFRTAGKWSCGLVMVGLAACGHHQPPVADPLQLPVAWQNAAGFPQTSAARDLTRWWRHFNDPQLTRLIADALHGNLDMATAMARIREARARRDQATAALLPTLDGGASSNSRRTRTDGLGTASTHSYAAALDASWEVDLFGKRRNQVAAATANVGVAEENFHAAQASLAAETAIAYCNLRATEARLEVLRRNVQTREQTSQLASWRQQAGEADSLESNQALTSLEQARAAVPALEQTAAQTRNSLATLTGRTPGSLDRVLATSARGIPDPARRLAVGIPADTLRQRPDLRAAGYSILAAAASTRAADAERFPSLNLSGSLGLNALSADKVFNPETTSANLLAGITSPIFDAGRIRANIAAFTAAEEQAIHTYRSTVLAALSETEDALLACRGTAQRLTILDKATTAARETLAQQRYEAGEIDFLDFLDAQRTLLALEDSLISTQTDRTIAYIQLYKALGGGWAGS